MYRKISIIIIACLFSCLANAQDVPAQVAHTISQKMKDTLNLSEAKEHEIYSINLDLHYKKARMRELYIADTLSNHIQRIENMRDSLYQKVLPAEKYTLYLQKKPRLISVR